MDFVNAEQALFDVFNQQDWTVNGIATYPANFTDGTEAPPYIRLMPSFSERSEGPICVGTLRIDIFIKANTGTRPASLVANALDTYLRKNTFSTDKGYLQFYTGDLQHYGIDSTNANLYLCVYTIPFQLTWSS